MIAKGLKGKSNTLWFWQNPKSQGPWLGNCIASAEASLNLDSEPVYTFLVKCHMCIRYEIGSWSCYHFWPIIICLVAYNIFVKFWCKLIWHFCDAKCKYTIKYWWKVVSPQCSAPSKPVICINVLVLVCPPWVNTK